MLIKVRVDELVGQDNLAYDVYDGCGNVLYRAGDRINLAAVRRAGNGLFRKRDKLSIEWLVREEMPHFSALDRVPGILEDNSPAEDEAPLFEADTSRPFLDSLFHFWRRLEHGEEMDMALLDVLSDKLIAGIITRISQLQYMNQLHLRDGVTYSHTLDVTAVSIALGHALGVSGADLKALALSAMLHDLGKLFIPKPIMFKTTRLTDKEFAVMQLHPELGYRIIRDEMKLPEEIARPALEHQELFAGGGYPQNLKHDGIHYFSHIVKIADVYDALTSKRPYKEAIRSTQAIRIMLLEGSKSFHPDIFRTFLTVANFPDPIPAVL